MEEHAASAYCSKCQDIQPVLELPDDPSAARRCQVCGFPLGSSLHMEDPKLGRATKVLVVDDDPLIIQMYRDLLEHNDFFVITAPDGTKGLELAARERPNILLLDIMMPGIDGFEVCRRLKADPALQHIPIIILTAMSDPKLNSQAFKAGANLALRKPAEPATVLRTIQAALALAATKKV
jgi:putative two-component system response regulator